VFIYSNRVDKTSGRVVIVETVDNESNRSPIYLYGSHARKYFIYEVAHCFAVAVWGVWG